MMLPSSVSDGKLNWDALLAESGTRVASQYHTVAYLDNTRTGTQVGGRRMTPMRFDLSKLCSQRYLDPE